MQTLIVPAWFLFGLFGLLGIAFGSFGNVLIVRLPSETPINGRSKCPHCGRTILVRELIPILSFAMLGGKCAGCRRPISLQYPCVEIVSALLFLLALLHSHSDVPSAVFLAVALWTLLLITFIDGYTKTIPDVLTILLGLSGLLLQARLGNVGLVAPLIGLLFFGAQWVLSKGKWVGSGDIFLSIAMGLAVGSWKVMVFTLMLSYIAGAC